MLIPFLIILNHFIADFVFQTDEQALNKSKSNKWLLRHVLTYTMFMILFCIYISILGANIYFVAVWLILNGLVHFITDWCTSRMNLYLWEKKGRHWFFVGIGADQVIHYACLMFSFQLLFM